MFALDNVIKPYAWGSTTALAELQGRAPSSTPEAELWVGAHPSSPSRLRGQQRSLLDHIAADPTRALGAESVARFGPRLPYLLKVLAAAQPLSLQAHPSKRQAEQGFARENALGLASDAPTRNYRDDNHKPELICALTPFQALCGFRRREASVALFRDLGVEVPTLERDGLRAFFDEVSRPGASTSELVARVARQCARQPVVGFEAECALGVRLAAQYPGDAGLIGALLLNLVTLQPGEALYLPAGNLHAYLEGVGVEVMASSDNVLRGGLTPKHVDVAELVSVLDFSDGPVSVLRPHGAPEATYATAAPDFQLSRVSVQRDVVLARRGPDVVLVTEGAVTLSTPRQVVALRRGEAAFVGADEGPLTLAGAGLAFRATVG